MTTRVDGLASGLNTTEIIQQLIQVERKPQERLAQRIEEVGEKKTAVLGVSAKLLALVGDATRLASPRIFGSTRVASSDESVLTASGGVGLNPGSFRFRVGRLATSQQFVSGGVDSSAAVGAGTIRLQDGQASVDRRTALDALNGGAGVAVGVVRLTDRSGATALVDVSLAETVRDVLEAINLSGIGLRAEVSTGGGAIDLVDTSGGGGSIVAEDVAGGRTAADLGIAGVAAGPRLGGGAVSVLRTGTSLALLNDGTGVERRVGEDLSLTVGGTSFAVDLSGVETVGEVLSALESAATAAGVSLDARVDEAGRRLVLEDLSGLGPVSVTDLSGAAADLGLAGSSPGAVLTGRAVLAGLDTVLVSSLHGGAGVAEGAITIRDRSGASATVDLTGAGTLREVLSRVNAAGIGVRAGLNGATNGLRLVDLTGGNGPLVVDEAGGTAAQSLGILTGPAGVEASVLEGEDLDLGFIHSDMALEDFDGGVPQGRMKVTNRLGQGFTVDLTQADDVTLRDVIEEINAMVTGVTASLNTTGDGLLLVDTTGGTGRLQVEDLEGGGLARGLRLAGTAAEGTPDRIDGSLERLITIDATDDLADVRDKLNTAGAGLAASLLQSGARGLAHLLLMSAEGGAAGRKLVDGRGGLSFSETVRGEDAAVLFGDVASGQPVVMRSGSNQMEGVVGDLGLSLTSTGSATVTISRDLDMVVETIGGFIERVNEVIEEIDGLTRYDAETETRGLLMGDSALRRIRSDLSRLVSRVVDDGSGTAYLPKDFGISIQRNGQLLLDEGRFRAALSADPKSVEAFFTARRHLAPETLLKDFHNGRGVELGPGQSGIRIRLRDGTDMDVDLSGSLRLGDVLSRINLHEANGGKLLARISTGGRSLELVDQTGGVEALSVSSLDDGDAHVGLGLNASADGATLKGRSITLTDNPGFGQRYSALLSVLMDPDGGPLTTRSEGLDRQADGYRKSIERMEERIQSMEERLIREFTNLEIFIGQSQNTMGRLTAALANLPRPSSRR
ncbi:MAG: flagellar filament capping protein FliD [Planctomycetes bacterium]|nr:flagellar filament capping protein FliD [Planctomycetota bacterium]